MICRGEKRGRNQGSTESRPTLAVKRLNRFLHRVASDDARVVAVMDVGEDVQADVLGGVRDDANEEADAVAIDGFHHPADFLRAIEVHAFEAGVIREKAEAGWKLGEEFEDFGLAALEFGERHAANVGEQEELTVFVERGQKHGRRLRADAGIGNQSGTTGEE